MPFVENDDFSSLINWDTNGELINDELVHHIPKISEEYVSLRSRFLGAHFQGTDAWSISLDYRIDVADISLRGYDPVVLDFMLKSMVSYHRYSLQILGAYDSPLLADIYTEIKSTEFSQHPEVYSAAYSGTITMSHDGAGELTITGGGYDTPQVFSDVIPPTGVFFILLTTSIQQNDWDEIKISFDNFSSTGGIPVPDPPVPIEGALKCGFGLKSILRGLSTNGSSLACGLAIGAEMTGGRENLTANLLVALGIDCSISGNQPTKCIMKAGICLTCLMRAESVPQNVLQHAFALGLEMKAGQSGQGELASGLFIGCKMGGSTGAGAYPCLSRDFSHMSWF